jgi:NADH-quinone oxidoreductase subunit L
MVDLEVLISLIPFLPLAGFLLIGFNVHKLPHKIVSFIACGTVLISFLFSLSAFLHLAGKDPSERSISVSIISWINTADFSSDIALLVDPLSSIMLLIITGVGFLIHVYSIGYMRDDSGYNRFFSYLNLFVFFMLILVMASNYLLMFVGWEGVGLCSYLLIGFWFKNHDYNKAANKAFIMNRIGDLGLLLGIILIFINFGSIEYDVVFANPSTVEISTITWITILLFIGAIGKSAQIPLYTWLPDAMAGPTPVSALIHAATMVTAGVYMVARNSVLYSLSPVAMQLVLVVGLCTALFAATIALLQNDIKKVLAYSTVSQLGLMFVALGVGAYAAGIFHMATHAFFKALLFLGAGSVIHALEGEQDIRRMGGLKTHLPITYFTFFVAVLAISGVPPFAGFFSKDEILANAFARDPTIWALTLLASLLTVFYMFRLFYLTFWGVARAGGNVMHHIHESPKSMAIPLIVLAFLSFAGGFMNVPEALAGTSWLTGYLSPVFEAATNYGPAHHLSHTTEYILMITVLTLTVILIAIAYIRFIKKGTVPAEEGQLRGVGKVLYHKYYVDEIYDLLFVRPLERLATMMETVIEALAIDRLVNSAGQFITASSQVLRRAQNGSIGFYIFVMIISIILLLTLTNITAEI